MIKLRLSLFCQENCLLLQISVLLCGFLIRIKKAENTMEEISETASMRYSLWIYANGQKMLLRVRAKRKFGWIQNKLRRQQIFITHGNVRELMEQPMRCQNFTVVCALMKLKVKVGHLHQANILSLLTMI